MTANDRDDGLPSHGFSAALRLRRGHRLAGLILKMPAPALVELAGYVGFDLVVIDTEHSPTGGDLLEHHLRAADAARVPALVRVAANDSTAILPALDAGAAGVIVPHVDTVAQAEAAVRAAHYPPRGQRGFALSTRAARYGSVGAVPHLQAAERVLVIVQVESAAALPHVAGIASTPGVDAVWIGPSDLSLSLGHPGDPAHPEVVAAIDEISTTVYSAGHARLCVLARNEDDARTWRNRGASVVLFSAMDVIATRLTALTTMQTGRLPIQPEATAEATATERTRPVGPAIG